MKTLISKFEKTLYNNKKSPVITRVDINKIKEFQEKGNLFGLLVDEHTKEIEILLEKNELQVDFIMTKAGSIYFKEGYQYFNYEPFDYKEIEEILSSLEGDFKAKIRTMNKEIEIEPRKCVNRDLFSSSIILYECQPQQIASQLENNEQMSLLVNEDEVIIFSKKVSIDRSVDALCGLKKISIEDVSIIADQLKDLELVHNVDNLYALTENNQLNKDVFIVESLGECVDIIMDDINALFFLSNFRGCFFE